MLGSREKLKWKWMTCSFGARLEPHPSTWLIYGAPLFRQLATNLTLQPAHHTEYRLARTQISHTDCLAGFLARFFQIFSTNCLTGFFSIFFFHRFLCCTLILGEIFSSSDLSHRMPLRKISFFWKIFPFRLPCCTYFGSFSAISGLFWPGAVVGICQGAFI